MKQENILVEVSMEVSLMERLVEEGFFEKKVVYSITEKGIENLLNTSDKKIDLNYSNILRKNYDEKK